MKITSFYCYLFYTHANTSHLKYFIINTLYFILGILPPRLDESQIGLKTRKSHRFAGFLLLFHIKEPQSISNKL